MILKKLQFMNEKFFFNWLDITRYVENKMWENYLELI